MNNYYELFQLIRYGNILPETEPEPPQDQHDRWATDQAELQLKSDENNYPL